MAKKTLNPVEIQREKEARKMCRAMVSIIFSEMARTDMSLEDISRHINKPYEEVLDKLMFLISGTAFKDSVNLLSAIFSSMGAEKIWNVYKSAYETAISHKA